MAKSSTLKEIKDAHMVEAMAKLNRFKSCVGALTKADDKTVALMRKIAYRPMGRSIKVIERLNEVEYMAIVRNAPYRPSWVKK